MTGYRLVAAPVFDPARALGWRDGPLDGITCVLRCVEAVLQAAGYSSLEVARCLGGEPDLLARDMALEFPGCRLEWRFAPSGKENWPYLLEQLSTGEPVIIMPDLYYYPGSYYEGVHHFHDHSVLATGWDPDAEVLTVLDTLGPPEQGYRRELPKTPELVACCTRMTPIVRTKPVDRRPSDVYAEEQVGNHAVTVAADARALRKLLEGYAEEGMDGVSARAVHLLVLGHLQPQLFLFGSSIGPDAHERFQQVRAAALSAATRANRFGRLLIAAHEQPDPAPYYRQALTVAPVMVDALDSLADAMCKAGGNARVDAQLADTADAALHNRLREIIHICYSPSSEAVL